MICAIIVAAGQGVRMKTSRPKQYLQLAGRPILNHTLEAFNACESIDRILVVVPADDTAYCRSRIIEPAGLTTPTALVEGGRQRQESVYNGLKHIGEEDGIVLIHDGVRPLVAGSIIISCIEGAKASGACIPAVEPVDTPKQVTKEGIITETISRDRLRMAQTPQAFQLSIIRKAHEEGRRLGWTATDDASLVERMGIDVKVIPGARENLKITTPEDLAIAEIHLSRRAR